MNYPGNSSQSCGDDSWYTFHLMYLCVAPVEAICSGMPEPVGNNVPTFTTVCLNYSNEIVPCISTSPGGQHFRMCDMRDASTLNFKTSLPHHSLSQEKITDRFMARKMQSLCQQGTENSWCDIKCIEEYTIASHSSMERHYLDTVTYICKSGYSLNGLCYGKKEFFFGCKSDGTYDVPHHTCQSINCILENAPIAKMIEFPGGFLPGSSPVVLGSNEWLKYQCGEGHTFSGIPDSSDLFTVTCLDGDHTMTHCKPVQCGDPLVIAHATPLGGCSVTITYGKQVEYQCEAGYHVESGRKPGSKPEEAPEEPVGAVSSCGHVYPLEERFVSWIGQQDRPFPSHEWLEDWSRAR